jgi:hypothetical protein
MATLLNATYRGAEYTPASELQNGSCHGCVAEGSTKESYHLCAALANAAGGCSERHVIWVHKAPTISQPTSEILDKFVPATAAVKKDESAPGRKDDTGKIDLTLLFDDCPHALEAVAEVLQWAITKKLPKPYERGSWLGVDDFQRRYRAAALRHQINAAKGAITGVPFEEQRDPETGLRELAHIACGAIFQLEKAIRASKEAKPNE